MPIHKSQHAGNFTTIPNDVFKNKLSIEALGLLCYLLSLPPKWIIYKTTLHKLYGMGQKKMDRVFKELQEKGYILSVKTHKSGKIEHEHIVYDVPFNGEKPLNFKNQPHPPNVGVENGCLDNFAKLQDPPFVGVEKALLVNKQLSNKHNKKQKENIYTHEDIKIEKNKSVSLNAFSVPVNPYFAAPLKTGGEFPKDSAEFKTEYYKTFLELKWPISRINYYWEYCIGYSEKGRRYDNWIHETKVFGLRNEQKDKERFKPEPIQQEYKIIK